MPPPQSCVFSMRDVSFEQSIIPRMTVKNAQKGTLTNINVNLLQKSRFTGKTRRGSFSFTVVLAHLMKP